MLQEELQATRAELATYGRQRDVSAEGSAALQKQLETLANTNESLQREVAALRKQLTDAQAQHAREMGELVASASAKALQRKLEQAERRIYEMNLVRAFYQTSNLPSTFYYSPRHNEIELPVLLTIDLVGSID